MKIDVRSKESVYITINGVTYYIDDSTDEQIVELYKGEAMIKYVPDTYAEGGGLKGKRNVILKKFISKSSNYSPSKNKVLEDWQINDKYARLRLTVNMDEISERQKIDLKDWEKEVKGSEFLDDVHNEEYWDFDGILELSEKAIISLNEVLNVEFDNKDYYFTYDLTDEGYAKNTSYAEGGEVGEDEDGNKYEILWGNDKPFKSGDMAYNPMSGIVMEVYFDADDENADDEYYVQETYAQVKKLDSTYAEGGEKQLTTKNNSL